MYQNEKHVLSQHRQSINFKKKFFPITLECDLKKKKFCDQQIITCHLSLSTNSFILKTER